MLAAASWRIALPYSSNGVAQLLTFHLFQPDIERHHPPLDIKMANHNLFAEIGDFFRCFLEQ